MSQRGESLPSGFSGPVRAWSSLLPCTATLQLPRERERLRDTGTHECIEVQAWTESLGRIESTLPQLVERLAPDGTLLLDIDNIQCARMLRLVVEGRPGQFDPAGSTDDPSLHLPLRRVLDAVRACGLLVRDVLRVPSPAAEFPPGLVGAMFQQGLMPLSWLQGTPPTRHWLVCRRQRVLAGSVLVAGGDAGDRERTLSALRAFLPTTWEIVHVPANGECAQWNRAVAGATGELVWFLRAGCEPTSAQFAALAARAGVGAVAPGHEGARCLPGDLAGLMLPRHDVLLTGPLPEHFANTRVALEEYSMLIDVALSPPELVEVAFVSPAAPVEQPLRFAAESAALVEAWSVVQPVVTAAPSPAPAVATPAPTPRAAPWQGREPRVTLCMIARNEERFLPECLTRARAAVDEIVLVDTGSTDRTVAIAESFGARVLHAPWQDDFSAPRNVGLQAATGDWILVLDADEFVLEGGCERIRELVQSRQTLGYHLRFTNVYGDGKTLGVMMVRLFRNLPGIAYQNVIHEQVTPSLQRLGTPLGLTLASAEVEVEHHGYSDAVMNERGKNERNERLFKKQLARDPDDIYSLYKFGDFLRRVPGRGADAKAILDRCLERIVAGPPGLPRELPYAGEVAALCALEAARLGDHDRARRVLDHALRRFVPTPNLHYLAASLALADGRAEDAILHYRRCLTYRGQVLVVPIQDGITGHVSLAGIAQAWMLRGDLERAVPLLEQAVALAPSYEVAWLALSKAFLLRGDPAKALSVLTTFVAAHPDSPGACQQLTLILQRLGQSAAAKRMGRHAVQLLEARALDHEAAQMNKMLAAM